MNLTERYDDPAKRSNEETSREEGRSDERRDES